ncbi:MAG: hypothetical protein ABIG42_05040 [bacterium]
MQGTKGWTVVIILLMVIFWFVIVVPYVSVKVEDGFKAYEEQYKITGPDDERRVSYDGEWTIFPLHCAMKNFQIQGMRFDHSELITYFDPDIKIEYIKFNPLSMMKNGRPVVEEMGNIDFKAKVHFITLMKMLEKRNPNFKLEEIVRVHENHIEISGFLDEVNSVVYLTGLFKVNAEGELEFEVVEVVNFIKERVTERGQINKVLDALDLKWRFNLFNVELDVGVAAVTKSGVYIEADKGGWKLEDLELIL